MTKQELIKQIARETGVEATTVSAVVEGFMEEVRAAQIRKENVFLRGFGTFLIKHRREKTARNITKNTTLKIPAHDIPAFKASPEFLRLLK
ncbi:HU family DNA-binding protein [Alistipes sp.]|jgi:DNA-binding protein HU-beta|uniref:HU family DNA-binding protein n=1 Tax=Alistipes sp. TaxID=1872444 RepID=UPI0025960969|nr:HU family DNA-binding protein [uncultured Alistipes sp.]